jgi:hypothetical protein
MVPVKQAVESAAAFAKTILGEERTAGLQLEEVDFGKHFERDAWKITLSMLRRDPFREASAPALMRSLTAARDYKTLIVDRETGDVLSMRIRELAHAERPRRSS